MESQSRWNSKEYYRQYRAKNREKLNARNKRWEQKNSEYVHAKSVRKYWPGLSIQEVHQEYNKLLEQQNGCCAICKKDSSVFHKGTKRSLAVDHCHQTGKVRGLLCDQCNRGIGLLKEDPTVLQSALQYLRRECQL